MKLGLILYARDLNALTNFYVDTFHFEYMDGDKTYARLLDRGTELVILQSPPEFVDVSTEPRTLVPMKPVFFMQYTLAEMRISIINNGGFFKSQEAEWEFEGHFVCDGHDIEGNIFQVRTPFK